MWTPPPGATYVPCLALPPRPSDAHGLGSDNQTAEIVERAKLLDAALAEHQFTYMEVSGVQPT